MELFKNRTLLFSLILFNFQWPCQTGLAKTVYRPCSHRRSHQAEGRRLAWHVQLRGTFSLTPRRCTYFSNTFFPAKWVCSIRGRTPFEAPQCHPYSRNAVAAGWPGPSSGPGARCGASGGSGQGGIVRFVKVADHDTTVYYIDMILCRRCHRSMNDLAKVMGGPTWDICPPMCISLVVCWGGCICPSTNCGQWSKPGTHDNRGHWSRWIFCVPVQRWHQSWACC